MVRTAHEVGSTREKGLVRHVDSFKSAHYQTPSKTCLRRLCDEAEGGAEAIQMQAARHSTSTNSPRAWPFHPTPLTSAPPRPALCASSPRVSRSPSPPPPRGTNAVCVRPSSGLPLLPPSHLHMTAWPTASYYFLAEQHSKCVGDERSPCCSSRSTVGPSIATATSTSTLPRPTAPLVAHRRTPYRRRCHGGLLAWFAPRIAPPAACHGITLRYAYHLRRPDSPASIYN